MKRLEEIKDWKEMINEVVWGDCIEGMKRIPDKAIDLILTDPPYNAKNIGPNKRVYEKQIMKFPDIEYKKFCKQWFRQAKRISKTLVFTPGIANTHNYPQPNWIIAWHKPAARSFNRFGGYNAWEPIFIYGKIAKSKRLGQDYFLVNTLNFSKGVEKNHPCPKPPFLWGRLVDKFSNEGELVLDPMMGSWTTARVCKDLNRNFIGFELEEKYCQIGEKRLEQEVLF